MKTAENEKYLIVNSEDKNKLNPIYIFYKKSNIVQRYNNIDILNMKNSPFVIEKEIAEFCTKNKLI